MWRAFRTVFPPATMLVVALASPLRPSSQPIPDTEPSEGSDPALYEYHLRCNAAVSSPRVLAMADTLWAMADREGDDRMKAVALCHKLDYYYYHGMTDSVAAHTARVQEFARATGQSKYFYFVWSKRLIKLHLKQGMTSTAMWEAQKMLETASAQDDQEGMANCYNVLSSVYDLKGMGEQVIRYRLLEIELIERYALNDYNVSLAYSDIAKWEISLGRLDSAARTLVLAGRRATTSSHRAAWLYQSLRYHIARGEHSRAEACLREIGELFDGDLSLEVERRTLYSARYDYYLSTGDIPMAIEAIERKTEELHRIGDEYSALLDNRDKGMLYYQSGEPARAAAYFRDYILARDSLFVMVEQNSSAEFATLFETVRLKEENGSLTIEAQRRQLGSRYRIIVVLIASLTLISILLNRSMRLNRRLTASGRELEAARREAEQASAMKSAFITNMSHEVRTPLNAIVGFSQLLADLTRETGAREYVRMVEVNNDKLLQLFDQVLILSDLDAGRTFKIVQTDLHACCNESIGEVAASVNGGVELRLEVPGESMSVFSNPNGIKYILTSLLSNAAKFTVRGSIVLSYTYDRQKGLVSISVTDTGPGIPDEKRQQMFERFTKMDEFAPGMGLGLAISSLTATKLSGTLGLDPDYTTGCRFILTLPLVNS